MQFTSPLHKNGAHNCKNLQRYCKSSVPGYSPQSDPEEACREGESSVVHAYGKLSNVFPINNGEWQGNVLASTYSISSLMQ